MVMRTLAAPLFACGRQRARLALAPAPRALVRPAPQRRLASSTPQRSSEEASTSSASSASATPAGGKGVSQLGMTVTDVVGLLILFSASTAFLLNEVKDMDDPKPKAKKVQAEQERNEDSSEDAKQA